MIPRSLTSVAALAALATLALLAVGCTDATGVVQGGQALNATCSDPTWACLYMDYFGPSGAASCSAAQCHLSADGTAAQISGFVCGATKDTCWQGMTQGVSGSPIPPILAPDAGTLTGTALGNALHHTGGDPTCSITCNNMPCGDPAPEGGIGGCHATRAAYTFTSDDIARITAWAQAGAPNN